MPVLDHLAVFQGFGRALPGQDKAGRSAAGHGAGAHPAIGPVAGAHAMLDVVGPSGSDGCGPGLQGSSPVLGMKRADPITAEALARPDAGERLPARTEVRDRAAWIGDPAGLVTRRVAAAAGQRAAVVLDPPGRIPRQHEHPEHEAAPIHHGAAIEIEPAVTHQAGRRVAHEATLDDRQAAPRKPRLDQIREGSPTVTSRGPEGVWHESREGRVEDRSRGGAPERDHRCRREPQ